MVSALERAFGLICERQLLGQTVIAKMAIPEARRKLVPKGYRSARNGQWMALAARLSEYA
jgi:hypothetical protein